MTATASSSENLFLSLLGSEYVRAAGAADAVGGLQPKLVVEPGTERELAEILRLSNEGGVAGIPPGGGEKARWGNPPVGASLVFLTAGVSEIIEVPQGAPTRTTQSR